MRRHQRSGAFALLLALCALGAVATAPALAGAPDAVARSPRPVSADTGPTASDGPAVPRPMLLVLAAAALVATAGAIWQERGSPRAVAHGRVVRRPRREVGAGAYRVARRLGFRYSRSRDALVLRAVGNTFGPVLRRRTVHAPLPLASPPPASPGRPARLVDLVCLPLPSPQHGRLWQLTAVDVDSRYTWAELTRPRGAAPSPEQALAFVQRIAAHLGGRGLGLDAVVVQAGSTHRRTLATAVELGDVQLLRALPGPRRHPIAAQRHHEISSVHWDHALAASGAPPLDLLERQLQRWIAADNETARDTAHDGLSPTAALGGAPVPAAAGERPRTTTREVTPPPTIGSRTRR